MLLNCGVGEDSGESLELQGDLAIPSKRNQSWVFIGMTDAEAETLILWRPDAKNQLIGKNPDAGEDSMIFHFLWSSGFWKFDLWFLCLSKSSLYIWKFLVHILLRPSLKDFEQNLASMWNVHNCTIVWTSLVSLFLGIGMKTDLSPSVEFSKFADTLNAASLTASSFRIWNSSAGIPSPPLALFIVILPKVHLISHSRMSGSRWMTTPSWLSRQLRSFLSSCSVYSCHLFLTSSAPARFLLSLSFIVHIFAWNVALLSPVFLEVSLFFKM